MPETFSKYSPIEWKGDHNQYITSGENLSDEHRRRLNVLGHLFTPLSFELFKLAFEQVIKPDFPGKMWGETTLHNRQVSHNRQLTYFQFRPLQSTLFCRDSKGPSIPLFTPVSDFGVDFSKALINSGRVLNSLIDRHLIDSAVRINKSHGDFIKAHTFHMDVRKTLKEATQSVIAGFAVLTPEKVTGYEENPLGVIDGIANNNLLSKLSVGLPFNYLAPMGHNGEAFYNPLTVLPDGSFDFSTDLKSLLVELKRNRKRSFYPSLKQLNRGCPVGHNNILDEAGEEFPVAGNQYMAWATQVLMHRFLEDPKKSTFDNSRYGAYFKLVDHPEWF